MNRFKVGRNTTVACPLNRDRMPDANNGCQDLKNIFIDHIYKGLKSERSRWRMTAAISGAHTLGQARTNQSGFNGHWSDEANQGKFNNDYYRSMLMKGWGPELEVTAGNEQWKRVDKFNASAVSHKEMMLNSDLCLAYHNNSDHDRCVDAFMQNTTGMTLSKANGRCRGLQRNNNTAFLLARESNCCAWTNTKALAKNGLFISKRNTGKTLNFCGQSETKLGFDDARGHCCANEDAQSVGDCDSSKWPKGPAFRAVLTFAANQHAWLMQYTRAWWIATENGHAKEGLLKLSMNEERMRKKRKRMHMKRNKRKRSKKSRKPRKASKGKSAKSSRSSRGSRSSSNRGSSTRSR